MTSLETLLARGGDALDGVAALLAWRDLRSASLSCRAAFASRLRWLFLRRTRVQLPPNGATCDALFADAFRVAHDDAPHGVHCLAIAHTACLESTTAQSCAWLAGVERLSVDPNRFVLPPQLTAASIDCALLAVRFPPLQQLSLAGVSDFKDATPLAQVEALRRLDLSATGIRDLAPLASLRQLEHLDISSTRVATLAPLQELLALRTVVLDVDGASCALAPLATWPRPPSLTIKSVRGRGHLERLGNDLLEVAPLITEFSSRGFAFQWRSSDNGYEGRSVLLSSMQNVDSLAISGALLLYRLDMIQTLAKLRVLHISTLRSSDISALAALQELEEVSLTSDKCVDLSPLALLPRLRSLYCHGGDPDSMTQNGRDESEMIQLHQLKVLDTSNHYLQRLHGLEGLEELSVYVWSGDPLLLPWSCARSLVKLRLDGDVALREIYGRFPRLRSLELKQCAPLDAHDLACFTRLESLTLFDPHPSALNLLDPMHQLRKLCIRGPSIKRVSKSMLASFPNLQELDLEKTEVEDISAIVVLLKLEMVNLKDTRVRDVTPLLMVPSLVTAILPKRAQCVPLVSSYHDKSVVSSLREVLHQTKNCLWGPHWRQRPRQADKIDRPTHVEATPESVRTSPVSELTELVRRCSIV